MNILAVGCHPDDVEIGCGGTLAKYAAQGHTVVMCHVTNGHLGHAVIPPDELVVLREKEAQEAAKRLGAAESVCLGVNDLEPESTDAAALLKLADLIRRVKPDLIITHSPQDYMRDHVEVGKMVFDASFNASVPHLETTHPAYGPIVPIYYMDTLAGVDFLPTEYVDIRDTIEAKLAAIDCHQTQVKWLRDHDHIDFLDFVKTCSKYRGLQCGAPFAEGFRQCMTWPRLTTKRLLP
jgi:LmbE family N-acetylglucosaminyl deacetylase